MAHIVKIEHEPDAQCADGEIMRFSFGSKAAALEFLKWNQKKSSVKHATYEGEQNATGNF